MEIEIFTVCDFAQDNIGKLTIVGTFDRMLPPAYPHIHPTFSVAGRLRFSQRESGHHDFQVRFTTPDGNPLIQTIEGEIEVVNTPETDYTAINFAFNFGHVTFEKPGKYAIELWIDEEWKSGISLLLANQN